MEVILNFTKIMKLIFYSTKIMEVFINFFQNHEIMF
jgi:hypothetical protein